MRNEPLSAVFSESACTVIAPIHGKGTIILGSASLVTYRLLPPRGCFFRQNVAKLLSDTVNVSQEKHTKDIIFAVPNLQKATVWV
ncbi:hypothetical protein CDAR_390291 [Caerostris darwini]|uniref:Uncharacterized protein n=1 Tax=Caerostris darwini TaxID=1538125 RepID=A0AAV4P067_9ARAC|nr:hypothetical protein CDAR_390291 [Caerostris darwini]